ncbi:interferon regulatory factor 4-like isoform X2 [Phyllobates terribilis]|uniref:interferon regulatory factor 4-like isoform X2 n=1 Tax=Phyllobates terribilis TaxID=111132 RepID=UPI003CCA7935
MVILGDIGSTKKVAGTNRRELDNLTYFGLEMSEKGTPPLRLKEWLILQIDSGKYPGLRWENEEKTVFKIPWKHAAKHNYKEEEDAALFKAWAVHKGKFREGAKEDPSVWKTRLRCALNKSPDFKEVMDSGQDFGEPYKVYSIVSDPSQKTYEGSKEAIRKLREEPPRIPMIKMENQMMQGPLNTDGSSKLLQLQSFNTPIEEVSFPSPVILRTQNVDHEVADISEKDIIIPSSPSSSDYWLHVRLYYQGKLVTEVTTQTAEGCRIIPLASPKHDLGSPHHLENILLPPPQMLPDILSPEMQNVVKKLLLHLDKGVFLWVAPDGVYIKRQCQVRVYWSGPLAPNTDQPNKLEREKTCKVLDMEHFMHEFQMYTVRKGPEPQYQIQLCFGEEYPGSTPNSKQLITAHVEPVFAREMLVNAKRKLRKDPPAD